jgi:hypothetical protein
MYDCMYQAFRNKIMNGNLKYPMYVLYIELKAVPHKSFSLEHPHN